MNFGGGIMVKRVQITAKYNIPIGRTGDIKVSDIVDTSRENLKKGTTNVKSDNTWQIALTYFF